MKVGSVVVDKVYWLESDGTLLCNGIAVNVNEDVTVILPQAVLVTVEDSVLYKEVDGDNVDEEVSEEVLETVDEVVALDVDFAVTEEDADATFVIETVLVGVVVVVKVDEAVTVEETELIDDAVLVGNDIEVVLTNEVDVPVELVEKVASEDAVVIADNVNVPVELVDKVEGTVADTDEESTLESETAVDGDKSPVFVAIKVTRDDADEDVVEDEVALDVEDAVAEEVALLVV